MDEACIKKGHMVEKKCDTINGLMRVVLIVVPSSPSCCPTRCVLVDCSYFYYELAIKSFNAIVSKTIFPNNFIPQRIFLPSIISNVPNAHACMS